MIVRDRNVDALCWQIAKGFHTVFPVTDASGAGMRVEDIQDSIYKVVHGSFLNRLTREVLGMIQYIAWRQTGVTYGDLSVRKFYERHREDFAELFLLIEAER